MSLQEVPRYPPAKVFSVALRLLLCSASLGFSPFSLWRAGHQRMGDPFGVLQPKGFQRCSVLKVPLFFFFSFSEMFSFPGRKVCMTLVPAGDCRAARATAQKWEPMPCAGSLKPPSSSSWTQLGHPHSTGLKFHPILMRNVSFGN